MPQVTNQPKKKAPPQKETNNSPVLHQKTKPKPKKCNPVKQGIGLALLFSTPFIYRFIETHRSSTPESWTPERRSAAEPGQAAAEPGQAAAEPAEESPQEGQVAAESWTPDFLPTNASPPDGHQQTGLCSGPYLQKSLLTPTGEGSFFKAIPDVTDCRKSIGIEFQQQHDSLPKFGDRGLQYLATQFTLGYVEKGEGQQIGGYGQLSGYAGAQVLCESPGVTLRVIASIWGDKLPAIVPEGVIETRATEQTTSFAHIQAEGGSYTQYKQDIPLGFSFNPIEAFGNVKLNFKIQKKFLNSSLAISYSRQKKVTPLVSIKLPRGFDNCLKPDVIFGEMLGKVENSDEFPGISGKATLKVSLSTDEKPARVNLVINDDEPPVITIKRFNTSDDGLVIVYDKLSESKAYGSIQKRYRSLLSSLREASQDTEEDVLNKIILHIKSIENMENYLANHGMLTNSTINDQLLTHFKGIIENSKYTYLRPILALSFIDNALYLIRQKENPSKAIQYLKNADELDTNNLAKRNLASAYDEYAYHLLHKKEKTTSNFEIIVNYLKKAIKLDPNNHTNAKQNLAYAYYQYVYDLLHVKRKNKE